MASLGVCSFPSWDGWVSGEENGVQTRAGEEGERGEVKVLHRRQRVGVPEGPWT